MSEPSIADVLARLDNLDRTWSLELRAVRAEVSVLRAEVSLQITQLRDDVRGLWAEHLGHTHPQGPADA